MSKVVSRRALALWVGFAAALSIVVPALGAASGTGPIQTTPGSGAPTAAGQSAVAAAIAAAAITPPPALTPIPSTSAEAAHVLKASAGNLYSVYAVNLTSTPGYLVVLNAATVPSDGAITPYHCVPLPPKGSAYVVNDPWSPEIFGSGIVAIATSASTCFTKTTGTITAFFKGDVQ